MKHFVFPTVQQANDFAAELKSEGLVREDSRYHGYGRGNTEGFAPRRTGTAYAPEHYERGVYEQHNDGVDAEEVGEEAVKGTAVGAVTGAAAGLAGAALTGAATAATVATGGLAAPLIGLTLLGSGVGAAVGAAGEAARESGEEDDYDTFEVDETRYGAFDEAYKGGGRAVAVDDNVPEGPLMEAAKKHGGKLVG